MVLVVSFIILFLYRLFMYIYRLLRCATLRIIYEKWLMDRDVSILRYEKEIITLFDHARISGLYFSSDRHEMKAVAASFEKAIGCFKYEIKRNFFPNYWIRKAFFAPTELIDYIGIRNVPIAKVLKVVLTLLYWSFATWDITALFSDSISSPLNKLLELLALIIENVF